MNHMQSLSEREKNMTTEELLDEVIEYAKGDLWDGLSSEPHYHEFQYLVGRLRQRIVDLEKSVNWRIHMNNVLSMGDTMDAVTGERYFKKDRNSHA